MEYRFGKENISKNISTKYIKENQLNKLMILGSERKKQQNSTIRQNRSCLKRVRVYDTGKEGARSGHYVAK